LADSLGDHAILSALASNANRHVHGLRVVILSARQIGDLYQMELIEQDHQFGLEVTFGFAVLFVDKVDSPNVAYP